MNDIFTDGITSEIQAHSRSPSVETSQKVVIDIKPSGSASDPILCLSRSHPHIYKLRASVVAISKAYDNSYSISFSLRRLSCCVASFPYLPRAKLFGACEECTLPWGYV